MIRARCLLSLAALLASCALTKGLSDIEILMTQPTHCTYEYAYDMYGAYCAGLRLDSIPSLKSGIEILEFSDNKLIELKRDTLSSYSSIKILYLSENHIYEIEEEALSSLTNLEILDLSKNVILNLPTSLLLMPYLRKLYLRGNPLIHLTLYNLAANKKITAPLELLDLSDCKLESLPEWGFLPQMELYNISNNPLKSLEPKHFAVMCRLKKLDISKSVDNINLCALKPAILWFKEKQVYFQLDDYSKLNTKEFDRCPSPEDSVTLNITYRNCEGEYMEYQGTKTSRRNWLTIGGGLAGFLVGFILLLYVMHRCNVARAKSATEKKLKPPKDGDKTATAVLLNNVS